MEISKIAGSGLPIILASYEDPDVYNLEETGLFFSPCLTLPIKSLFENTEEAKGR